MAGFYVFQFVKIILFLLKEEQFGGDGVLPLTDGLTGKKVRMNS